MKRSNLRKDYFWNSLGVFLQNALGSALLIIITRLNGIYDSGLFSYALAVAVIFWVIGIWGGRTYQVSDVKRDFFHASYIMTRLLLGGAVLVSAALFCILNQYDAYKSFVIITLVLFKVIESIADSIYGIMQADDQLYLSGRSLFLKAVLGFSVFAAINVFTRDMLSACLGLVVVNLVVLFFYDIPQAKKIENVSIGYEWIGSYFKQATLIIRRCTSIFAVSFLAILSLNIPRYFIDTYHTNEMGYFGIIAMLITLIILTASFVLQPSVSLLARSYGVNNEVFKKTVLRVLLMTAGGGGIITLVTYLAGVQLLGFIFGIDFHNYRAILIIMLLGGTANALVAVLMNIMVVIRHIKVQFYTLFITNTVMALVAAPIIKIYSIEGAVWLFALTNIAQLVLMLIAYKRIVQGIRNGKKN